MLKREKIRGPNTTLYITGLCRFTKQKFKAWCADHDISMTEKIEQLMKETVRR